jgi:glycosyltransferase involved in cell wall biosynthesis
MALTRLNDKEFNLDISVIVCAKNAERTIEQCLESVRKSRPSEVIVVDGNSTDDTVGIARQFTENVYSDEGKGLAYARQLGAEKASSTYISYVDSDVILPENCLARMLEEIKERGYAGIHAQIIGLKSTNYWEWAEDQHFRMRFNKEGTRQTIGTIAAIFERDKILKYKFDPFFTGAAEDGDLCYRLRKDEFTLGVSSAFAYHQHRANAKSFIRQRIWYGRGRACFFWKHRSALALFGGLMMVPFGVLACIRKRSPKIFPYYVAWSVASDIGMLRELLALTCRKLMPDIP